ncbi:precorrin-6A/cobalt-precorrin-6A reductase [Vulcanococcus limneticus Candia 3F8]|uniref:precorrin-6A/cobalt-precorrin-6A reductase n=1 Tax=Vulcanococcus limneticus TaxID=2170428 RepID=UPI000B995034|nr:precorrin-6A/cobalt-precorrin-6A reductase [Vulcanococcus limneticus]MCP9790645.1 precorrin-6A/cobalt-precorrin-6A reductase [Vulcanococcus limneticus MW73D5]MCP9892724.1 precorrin-6A/cobalt-precorrin-6A reductase [Vulcanococcus limneticus Candia 3F8]MCP9896252.1 precorrin-6A/cobalt-precorrin-6A reductase [Vulcanococcus limneticus Candia 3B3]
MHGHPFHQGDAPPEGGGTRPPAIWLLSGTGEGPPLAAALLARGWGLRVSVVSVAATRAYSPHPQLELQVGALGGMDAIRAQLRAEGAPRFRWVVDGTHPFARRISADLQAACAAAGQPLLRLERPGLAEPEPRRGVVRLEALVQLAQQPLAGDRLLLAIGSRGLAEALRHSQAAAHFARILDNPLSLQLARAAGLADAQLACLRPGKGLSVAGTGGLERALCRRWGITAVLCRASGGSTETLWRQVCAELDLRLLLLQRPPESAAGLCPAALLAKLGHP